MLIKTVTLECRECGRKHTREMPVESTGEDTTREVRQLCCPNRPCPGAWSGVGALVEVGASYAERNFAAEYMDRTFKGAGEKVDRLPVPDWEFPEEETPELKQRRAEVKREIDEYMARRYMPPVDRSGRLIVGNKGVTRDEENR